MISKVIKEAEKWIGYLEKASNNNLDHFTKNAGYKNYTIFAKQYKEYFNINLQGCAWCAMFVSCVFRNALGAETQKRIMPHFSYCPTGVNQFKQMKRWYTSNPQRGDVIFFLNVEENRPGHTGIIYDVDSKYIYTIEGNTSMKEGVVPNGGAVCKKKYTLKYNRIVGFGRPDYSVIDIPWQQEFLDKLVNRGFIENPEVWKNYESTVSKALCVALIDKITGGIWTCEETNPQLHWAQPHVISLCGKQVIKSKNEWLSTLEQPITKGLILALVDKATDGGTLEKYANDTYEHWATRHLNSLHDKGIIETPNYWKDNFDGNVDRGSFMALLCKAYNIK